MLSYFNPLLDLTRHTQIIQLIDALIYLKSTSYELLDFSMGELTPLLPIPSEKERFNFQCIIENTAYVADLFPDILSHTRKEGKSISSPELGRFKVFRENNASTIVIENVGTVWHSGSGAFIILIDSNTLAATDGNKLNIQGLLNLLISEVLLITNKFLAHAGCTGFQGECQLWTGDSGSGKTTRTLDLVSRGFDFYGDDQVIIGLNAEGEWCAWPFWRSVKVTEDSIGLLQSLPLLTKKSKEVSEKTVINEIEKTFNTQKPLSGRITSINLLVPHQKNVKQLLNLEEAFQRIAPGFMHALLPNSVILAMDNVIDLLSSVPARAISWDMLDIPDSEMSS